jgi:hypothetical protein
MCAHFLPVSPFVATGVGGLAQQRDHQQFLQQWRVEAPIPFRF